MESRLMAALETAHSLSLRISKRDIDILRELDKYNSVSARQLEDLFWGPQNHNGFKRLRLLAKKGFIQPLGTQYAGRLYYRLTPKGHNWLLHHGHLQTDLSRFRPRYSSAFPHDEKLNQIRRKFESTGFSGTYTTEAELRRRLSEAARTGAYYSNYFKIPDALLETVGSDGTPAALALELEFELKSLKQYRKIFQTYATTSDFEIIVYLLSDQSQIPRFRRLLANLAQNDHHTRALLRDKPIYFGVAPEALSLGIEAQLISDRGPATLRKLLGGCVRP